MARKVEGLSSQPERRIVRVINAGVNGWIAVLSCHHIIERIRKPRLSSIVVCRDCTPERQARLD